MGASIQDSGGNRGKRALDAELNLVPFIDLLCSLISFLLMTAVWTQIARLELKSGNAAPSTPTASPTPPVELDLRVEVHEKGFTLVEGQKADTEAAIPCTADPCWKVVPVIDEKTGQPAKGKDGAPLMTVDSKYDYKTLADKLKEKKAGHPDQKSLVVVVADGVPYNEMVRTMDTALEVGLDGISVSGTPL